jgi:hypothetical protein
VQGRKSLSSVGVKIFSSGLTSPRYQKTSPKKDRGNPHLLSLPENGFLKETRLLILNLVIKN